MKKVVLIYPSSKDSIFGKMKTLALPPMGLGILASRTPEDYEVTILDENVESIDFSIEADLVGVSATTFQAPRAYQIIEKFKKRGIPCVMGGSTPRSRTQEALLFADAAVIGEADEIWPKVLQDFSNNDLQPIYRAQAFPSLLDMPKIDRSHFYKKYHVQSVQTSRGCPCNCNFCSVTLFNGQRYRFRPVDQVVEEIAELKVKGFFISDDSIVGLGNEGIAHAKNLFSAMRGLNKMWGAQVCLTVAEHDDLLKGAALAGAKTFYIGFESIQAESLKSMNKGINLRPAIRNYKETIKRFHEHGIGIIGGFILGSDGDSKDIFRKTIDFVHDTGIDGCQFTVMTPFPGTRLYDQMVREGRLLYTHYPRDWGKYNAYDAVIEPKNMSIEELLQGQRQIYEETSTFKKSLWRGIKSVKNTRSLNVGVTNFFWNYYNFKAAKGISLIPEPYFPNLPRSEAVAVPTEQTQYLTQGAPEGKINPSDLPL